MLRAMDMATETAGAVGTVKAGLLFDPRERTKRILTMWDPATSALNLGPPDHHRGGIFRPDGADERVPSTATAVPPPITQGGTAHGVRDGL